MILSTRRLFCRLLGPLEIATVCDVGSMDGSDALRFRRMLPGAAILALEPNPKNFCLMQSNERLRRQRIRLLPVAASDRDSEAEFYVLEAEYGGSRDFARRGMSSLHRRSGEWPIAEIARVRTVRLDHLLKAESCAGTPTALWIDAEGTAFEAISGASGALCCTQMLHVEVETVPCIGTAQRLFPDVERLLIGAGFALLATDQSQTAMQFNAMFVRADLLRTKAAQIHRHVRRERLRATLTEAVRPLLPPPVRRFVLRRVNAVRGA